MASIHSYKHTMAGYSRLLMCYGGKVIGSDSAMDQSGRLKWDAPEGGRWIVLRIGHTVAGGTTRSSQPEATGLECNKLSKSSHRSSFFSLCRKIT